MAHRKDEHLSDSLASLRRDSPRDCPYAFQLKFCCMRVRVVAVSWLVVLCGLALAQEKAATHGGPVTVPAAIDHNRVIINAELQLANGSTETIRACVDTGSPELSMSRRVATLLNLPVTCGDQECSSPAPKQITVGDMVIPLSEVKVAKIPLRPVNAAAVLAPGMPAEITLPSSVLRNYDVLIDFAQHRFSVGAPGTIHFRGSSEKVTVTDGGLIQVPGQIEKKKYNLALDLGSPISFLSDELFEKLAAAHPDWPRMIGGVGPANVWGANAEAKWPVMRVDRVQFGPLFLTDVPVVAASKSTTDGFEKQRGTPIAGVLGSEMISNYRVGLDYAGSTVYFDIAKMSRFPDFDVVGLVLRPEDDGRYTILSVVEFEGKPSVPGVEAGDHLEAVDGIPVHGSTMGQVWAMLGGTPGQERRLTVERAGKELVVPAKVQHFLAALPEGNNKRKK